jgi:hypothetical protein
MKELNVREMRASIGRLAELVEAEGELVISRRGRRSLGCCQLSSAAKFPAMPT